MAREPEVTLVGVVHGDPGGYGKLMDLLEQVRPRLVSVEISVYSCRYRRRHQECWQEQFRRGLLALPPSQRQHAALRRVAAQIAWPFEVRGAQAYARRGGGGWKAVDLGSLARQHLPTFNRELLSPENLRHLSTTPDAGYAVHIQQEYRRARRELGAEASVPLAGLHPPVSPQESLREKVLAHRVAGLARRWRRVVHVGGWEHLRRGGPRKTMADFLSTFNPRLILLDGTHTFPTGNQRAVLADS